MKDHGDRMDRFAVFPFSMGCVSHSAVSVVDPQRKKPQNDPSTTQSAEESGGGKTRGTASPGIVAAGVQRLIKGFKSLSQMFVVYEEEEDEERDMVIGFPTDVQHVGHIGWDGFNKVGGMSMMNTFSLTSSLSLKQLEIAMESQACP